jgi:hypothetical protein
MGGLLAGSLLGSMIAREFFAGEGLSHEAGQEEGITETDQAMDDGEGFDAGGGFDDLA